MQILSRYMDIVISDVAFSTLYMPTDPNARVDAPDNKKLKCAPTEINKNELEYIILYKRHIHVVFELLDIIGVGQIDDQICMIDMIKLSQLTTKYFFWSMIEEGKIVNFSTHIFRSNLMPIILLQIPRNAWFTSNGR